MHRLLCITSFPFSEETIKKQTKIKKPRKQWKEEKDEGKI